VKFRILVAPALVLAAFTAPASAADTASDAAGDRLGAMISSAVRSGGPFFDAADRAVIERKCGYEAGSWDGIELSMVGNVFRCTNGRQLDDPEVRTIVRRAEPAIEKRVSEVMARPEIAAEIDRIANDATHKALAALEAAPH
jgi:hypothetical protein